MAHFMFMWMRMISVFRYSYTRKTKVKQIIALMELIIELKPRSEIAKFSLASFKTLFISWSKDKNRP